jgi:hypothetical protein
VPATLRFQPPAPKLASSKPSEKRTAAGSGVEVGVVIPVGVMREVAVVDGTPVDVPVTVEVLVGISVGVFVIVGVLDTVVVDVEVGGTVLLGVGVDDGDELTDVAVCVDDAAGRRP